MAERWCAVHGRIDGEDQVACPHGFTSCVVHTERPILFSTPMVRAILRGQKTQTRRMVRALRREYLADAVGWSVAADAAGRHVWGPEYPMLDGDVGIGPRRLCPYGQPGDRLWMRETWVYGRCVRHDGDVAEAPCTCRPVRYAADHPPGVGVPRGEWRPSIHMARRDARVTMTVADVRVERVQAITEADAAAEGVGDVREYRELWVAINGAASWRRDPWVWVVTFKDVRHVVQTGG